MHVYAQPYECSYLSNREYLFFFFFFFNEPAPPEISPLPQPAPLPISPIPFPPLLPERNPAVDPAFTFSPPTAVPNRDRKSTRLNSSHVRISYAVFCLKKKKYEQMCDGRRNTPRDIAGKGIIHHGSHAS